MRDELKPRGIRNNNPGNLRVSGDRWQGLDLAATAADGEFFVFTEPVYGIRAIARTLITYQDKYGIHSVQDAIDRWAPPSENRTNSYADFVRGQCGITPGQQVDFHDFATAKKIICAIIHFECGAQTYSDAQIVKGLVLAGLEPPKAPVAKSRTMKGAVLGIAATGLAAIGDGAQDAAPYVEEWYRPALDFVGGLGVPTWAFMGIAVLGIGIIMYARWDDSRKGLR